MVTIPVHALNDQGKRVSISTNLEVGFDDSSWDKNIIFSGSSSIVDGIANVPITFTIIDGYVPRIDMSKISFRQSSFEQGNLSSQVVNLPSLCSITGGIATDVIPPIFSHLFDEEGLFILRNYVRGAQKPVELTDERWGNYVMRSDSLSRGLFDSLEGRLGRGFELGTHSYDELIGSPLIDVNMLHGEGGTGWSLINNGQIQPAGIYTATRHSDGKIQIVGDFLYTFYDKIDSNCGKISGGITGFTDCFGSLPLTPCEITKRGGAYDLKIQWRSRLTVLYDPTIGKLQYVSGWPKK
jgi:hypothetical protein